MKPIFFSIIITMLCMTNISCMAGNKQFSTDTVTIAGNCGQCKDRIEEAAYKKKKKSAVWDKKTKVLTVVFDPAKTDLDKITAAIARAGHDSRNHVANDKDYKKLPACCAYRSGACHHE